MLIIIAQSSKCRLEIALYVQPADRDPMTLHLVSNMTKKNCSSTADYATRQKIKGRARAF